MPEMTRSLFLPYLSSTWMTVADDVALLGHEASDLDLHPRGRDLDDGVPSRAAVAETGEHVGDGVCH
jgi:hypothetical protein